MNIYEVDSDDDYYIVIAKNRIEARAIVEKEFHEKSAIVLRERSLDEGVVLRYDGEELFFN